MGVCWSLNKWEREQWVKFDSVWEKVKHTMRGRAYSWSRKSCHKYRLVQLPLMFHFAARNFPCGHLDYSILFKSHGNNHWRSPLSIIFQWVNLTQIRIYGKFMNHFIGRSHGRVREIPQNIIKKPSHRTLIWTTCALYQHVTNGGDVKEEYHVAFNLL